MLSGYIFELYTCVQVQKCNKNMCIHTLAPGGRPRVSFFFAGGALPVYDVRNCIWEQNKIFLWGTEPATPIN
jgi:hypothetical protein